MSGETFDADVAIIGSGIAGALMAHRLASRKMKVIVLEAGPDVTRAGLHETFLSKRAYTPTDLDPRVDYAPTTHPADANGYLLNEGSANYNLHMSKMVGGSTWHWAGGAERFPEKEFRLHATYGVGVDWPISYSDIEPHYTLAEHEMGVSVPLGENKSAWRSKPPPMTDFAWPYLYKRLREKLAPHGYAVDTLAFARNLREYDGRPACRGNNTCWPLCPIGAQYSGIVHIDKARAAGAEVRPQALVVRLEQENGRIVRAVYRRPDGSLQRVSAKYFAIAANGVETPKILLASRSEAAPNGLANRSDQVGRNFMDHWTVITSMKTAEPLYPGRGPIAFGKLMGVSDGEYRRERGAINIAFENRMSVDLIAAEVLREGYRGDALDRELRERATHRFEMTSGIEMLPDPDSRMSLDWERRDSAGQPRLRINMNPNAYVQRSLEEAARIQRDIAAKLGAEKIVTRIAEHFGHHPAGGTRMGADPKRSVVNGDCRTHDHDNLYLASSAVFPTLGGAHGPTLTIAALALRSADKILAEAGGR